MGGTVDAMNFNIFDPTSRLGGRLRSLLTIVTAIYGVIQAFGGIDPTSFSKTLTGILASIIAVLQTVTHYTPIGNGEVDGP